MFEHLTLRGAAASILWGYHPAATLRRWSIAKAEAGHWVLRATVERKDDLMCRQKGLLFTAPHEHGRDGWWAWGIESLTLTGPQTLRARLGPPEQ